MCYGQMEQQIILGYPLQMPNTFTLFEDFQTLMERNAASQQQMLMRLTTAIQKTKQSTNILHSGILSELNEWRTFSKEIKQQWLSVCQSFLQIANNIATVYQLKVSKLEKKIQTEDVKNKHLQEQLERCCAQLGKVQLKCEELERQNYSLKNNNKYQEKKQENSFQENKIAQKNISVNEKLICLQKQNEVLKQMMFKQSKLKVINLVSRQEDIFSNKKDLSLMSEVKEVSQLSEISSMSESICKEQKIEECNQILQDILTDRQISGQNSYSSLWNQQIDNKYAKEFKRTPLKHMSSKRSIIQFDQKQNDKRSKPQKRFENQSTPNKLDRLRKSLFEKKKSASKIF